MSEIPMLVKIRDGLTMAADGINEYIEKLAPETEKSSWDPSKIKWTNADGSKGPYEKAEQQNGEDFKAMLEDLKQHSGKLTRDNMFYWIFHRSDQTTVGRKKRTR